MENSDEDEIGEMEIDARMEESSSHDAECGDQIEKVLKGNFDVNARNSAGVSIKLEIGNQYEYEIKKENDDCIKDCNEELDAKVLKFNEIIMKSEVDDSVEDNTNQIDRDQSQNDSKRLKRADCSKDKGYRRRYKGDNRTKSKCRIKTHKLLAKKAPEDNMLNCSDCDYRTKLLSKLRAHKLKHKEYEFSCKDCDYQTNSKQALNCHRGIKHKKSFEDDNQCVVCRLVTAYKFSQLSVTRRLEIIKEGRPTPKMSGLSQQVKNYTRHFQTENYDRVPWLTGCPHKSALFCWPCLLFSEEERNAWNKYGFTDLSNLRRLIPRHSISKTHGRAVLSEASFGRNPKFECCLIEGTPLPERQHNDKVRENRDVLKRFIDVACYLGLHKMASRDCDEHEVSANYKDLVELLSKHDETLRNHLLNSNVFTSTSAEIQNDLIRCVSDVILEQIRQEVRSSHFVAIIIDETSDHLSSVLRYFLKSGKIVERFLGFRDGTPVRTANTMYSVVTEIIKSFNCGPKLVAQSYDGASVLTGELGVLQAKVQETYSKALFVHCKAHRLDVVLEQSLSTIKECRVFFDIFNRLASFVSESLKQSTAWCPNVNGRILVHTLYKYRDSLIEVLENMVDHPEGSDMEMVISGRGYLDLLRTNFDFNFFLLVFAEIFPFCDQLIDVLQSTTIDINFCVEKSNEFRDVLRSKTDQFDDLWSKITSLHSLVELMQKRALLDNFIDFKARYEHLFLAIIDTILMQTDCRFSQISELKFLELLNFRVNKCVDELAFECLTKNYGELFDLPALRSGLTVIYESSLDLDKSGVFPMWNTLKSFGLEKEIMFAEVAKLCELAMIIPCANVTETFSALDRIKTYARDSTSEDRLSHLSIMSIEKEMLRDLLSRPKFYDDVIDEFAKSEKVVPLLYK